MGVKDRVAKLDDFQQEHRFTAVVWAVNKKYGDDRGGYLCALIAYYGFVSIFPLILGVFSVLAYVLPGHPGTIKSIEGSVGSFPIVGPSLQQLGSGTLKGSVTAIVIGVAGLLWGSKGLAQTLQYAMDEIWNVPGKDRPGFVARLTVAVRFYVPFGLGVILSTFVASFSHFFNWGPAGPVLAALPALVVNVAVFLVSFRVLSPDEVSWRDHVPGAVVAGVAWTVLTTVGIGLITHQVNHSKALYGTFGTTLGLLGFLYLAARLSLYAAEYNAVRLNHLWPRSLMNPPLNEADRRQLADIAKREERVDDQTVTVEF